MSDKQEKDSTDEEFFKTQTRRIYSENNENILNDPEIKKLRKMQKKIYPEINLLWNIEIILEKYRESMSDNNTKVNIIDKT